MRGDGEEVRAILPVDVPLADQFEVGLADERGGLQRADPPFARHVARRDQVQLLVDERHQTFERLLAPASPFLQQPRDVDPLRSHGGGPPRGEGEEYRILRRMLFAVVASILLGLVMTLGDWAWAALEIRHRVVYGLAHGALMCLCLGLAVGVRAGQPAGGALAGPIIGIIAAGSFYALAPMLRWSAMFPAWMLLWILFALLQQRLTRKEAMTDGADARVRRGAAFRRGLLRDLGHLDQRLAHQSEPAAPFRRVDDRVPAGLHRVLFLRRAEAPSAGGGRRVTR